MRTGVVVLNFGEPPEPDPEVVTAYLEGIFRANARLDGGHDRARELAGRRAPGLLEEYAAIGGSPLNLQATAQAIDLEHELARRGYDAATYVGMQFTQPSIADAVTRARDDGAEALVGLPIYPLCGPSTTVAALDRLDGAVDEAGWDVPVSGITGWHRHPLYNRIRAENVAAFTRERGVSLDSEATRLVFSAHGTPLAYVEEGSRYVEYVEEYCRALAALLGVEEYELGYQNHRNRGIEWTAPDVEEVIESVEAERVVVEPVSFMHEQSETLSELDVELKEEADAAGVDFHRVPVPHDDGRFPSVLADLVEPRLAGVDPGYYNLRPCRCRAVPGTVCLNAGTAGR